MFHGVFQGCRAQAQPKHILILGESHYGEQISTQHVVAEKYLTNPGNISYRFFNRIAKSFGYSETERENFWAKVWFGNYVDEPCGVGDMRARKAIQANRRKYNLELLAFINQYHIDYVFCFSRLVYSKLPSLCPENGDSETCETEDRTHYLMKCIYEPGYRPDLGITLNRSVTVYGLKHPSRGFNADKYSEFLAEFLKK